jgi:hypothetical protein
VNAPFVSVQSKNTNNAKSEVRYNFDVSSVPDGIWHLQPREERMNRESKLRNSVACDETPKAQIINNLFITSEQSAQLRPYIHNV